MQEVVGSSPIIRLKPQEIWGFHLANQWDGSRQTFCMHRGSAQEVVSAGQPCQSEPFRASSHI